MLCSINVVYREVMAVCTPLKYLCINLLIISFTVEFILYLLVHKKRIMRTYALFHKILLLSMGIILFQSLHGQVVEYKHPLFDVGFMASPSWEQELHDNNGKIFQVTNPNNNMRINLSFIPDCRNPQKYMKRISGMKGLICPNRPYDTLLNNKKAVIMSGMCLQAREPFRRLVIGIPDNAGLYLIEFCCPEDCYVNHQSRLHSIMGSIKVGA